MRILVLTRYGQLGASSRLRMLQYFSVLNEVGFIIEVQAFFDDAALAKRYLHGGYGIWDTIRSYFNRIVALLGRNKFDLLWIEKEALPWFPLWIESALLKNVPYVLDYDDAVFHNYDLHRFGVVRHIFGRRLDGLIRKASLTVAGNEYLAQRTKEAGATWVEILPTVIDLERYPINLSILASDDVKRIVWIGSPTTARYLLELQEPLQLLASRVPFVLRVIGADIAIPNVNVECMAWSESIEVDAIASSVVGVMPLLDSPWERGKCGYKLIQYMACSLPVVASPIGVNNSIVKNGVNGFLAGTKDEWVMALENLLNHSDLTERLGHAGRNDVEQKYCLQVTAFSLTQWLGKVGRNEK